MVASVGRITADAGYDYLTKAVATSKHDYYTGAGEAPGVWTGGGAALLGLSGEVDAEDMAVLYGRFVVPSTAAKGGVLQRGPDGWPVHEQVLGQKPAARKRPDGTVAEPLVALDVTFSPSKSVSVLWGLSSRPELQDTVVAAHEEAVATALGWLDEHAGHTRAGRNGVRKVPGEGFVIAQFRHRTARSTDPGRRVGDPQLHSHCAILNRVRGEDGRWRTLDSKAIFRHAHAAGGVYAATLERLLSQRLGVVWEAPGERVAMREIAGIPAEVRARFSTRRADVLAMYDELEGQWRDVHGRSPTVTERAELHQQATLRSRNPKAGGIVDLHGQWRFECTAGELAAVDAVVGAVERSPGVDVAGGRLVAGSEAITEAVFTRLHEQKAVWTRANIAREVADLIDDTSVESIDLETERIAALCVNLEPDSDDEYASPGDAQLTSQRILDAETRVMAAAARRGQVRVEARVDRQLGDDQAAAVRALTVDGQQVQTIVGPAGAGKTTMLRSVADSWTAAGKQVVVLALSASAARVVTEETGLVANTVASWRVGAIDIPRGGMVIVDEASMVPTLCLDELVRVAGVYGTRVALIGDFAQMGSPEAGGLLRDLAATPQARLLVTVRRFRQEWERAASTVLRSHEPSIAGVYDGHGRIKATTIDEAVVGVADAWFADSVAGLDSVIVVDTDRAAAELSGRCQQLLRVEGRLGDRVLDADQHGNPLHVGDVIQTRQNTGELDTSDGSRVLNRDVWRITGVTGDGRIKARSLTRRAKVKLTADYVGEHVVLAYATTIAGAQGRTTDTGHVLVTPRTSSQSVYVGMTRGREANYAHVITDGHDHDEFRLGYRSAPQAFAEAIVRTGDGEKSAHRVRKEWAATEPQRAADRRADRERRALVAWWDTARGRLPAAVQTVLEGNDHEVLDALARFADPASRAKAVRLALRQNDWGHARAGRRFVQLIAGAGAGRVTPPADRHGAATRPERGARR